MLGSCGVLSVHTWRVLTLLVRVGVSTADVQAKKAAEKAAQEAKDLEMLFSWCRHGKYAEIEEFIQSPDNTLHIDTRDAAGNTLLLVSAQNGNKRIAKLCMRRGADVNAQNVRRRMLCRRCVDGRVQA